MKSILTVSLVIVTLFFSSCSIFDKLDPHFNQERYYYFPKKSRIVVSEVESEGTVRGDSTIKHIFKLNDTLTVIGRVKYRDETTNEITYSYLVEHEKGTLYLHKDDLLVDNSWGEPDRNLSYKYYQNNSSTSSSPSTPSKINSTNKDYEVGKRGGEYYINKNGNKTYKKKKK
jgi:hypothetical protein